VNLIGKSEVTVGFWTGSQFLPFCFDSDDLGAKLDAKYWAVVEPLLPDGVKLRHQRILDVDTRI
jgi:hypothetical protein